jgi:CheY-like chemotaxis protein
MHVRPRVLVVEDNADLRALLEQLLSADYLVATAGRGAEGVTLAASFHPDIILLDLQLPDMDGAEVGRRIKRELRDVPVLVLSASATPERLEDLRKAGCCDAFLPKPATIEAIRHGVAELLDSGSGTEG